TATFHWMLVFGPIRVGGLAASGATPDPPGRGTGATAGRPRPRPTRARRRPGRVAYASSDSLRTSGTGRLPRPGPRRQPTHTPPTWGWSVAALPPFHHPCRLHPSTLFGRGRRPCEPVGVAQLQPGHVHDLLRVAPEVGDAVEDRPHPGHVEPLDAADFGQP